MGIELRGRARRLANGDDVNSDCIITSARKRDTLDESVLKRYLLETLDPAFAASVRPGDLLVAGRNFGCGSAMEIAATVLLAAGITAVLARSFSRTFYRNAVNNGLVPVECDTDAIGEGDTLEILLADGAIRVTDRNSGQVTEGKALPHVMLEILKSGGLVPYIRENGGFAAVT